jgi:hypothetical protein
MRTNEGYPMSFRFPSRDQTLPFTSFMVGAAALALLTLTGCGIGAMSFAPSTSTQNDVQPNQMSGILHGAPNPIGGATVTLYATGSGYGTGATSVATTTSNADGSFTLTLPTTAPVCAGGDVYITAYQGTTSGQSNANPDSLLLSVVGSCSANYSYTTTGSGPSTVYTNTYSGKSVWIDELTTAVSTYALAGFMSVNDAGVVNIGAPANNTATASTTTPAAAGLAHAFSNVANMVNLQTGQPYLYTKGAATASLGGTIPQAELYLVGNILQSCVNSTGLITGAGAVTTTSTANDGSNCGKLFSLTAPPTKSAAVPTNTMEAMLDLAKFPNPSVNTWNSGCTAAGSGSMTATACLFGLAPATGAPYANALQAAPPDWSLAVVYTKGYATNITSCTGSCPGLTTPFYLALDYQDNVFIENWNSNPSTASNLIGLAYDGSVLFTNPTDTTNVLINFIATDMAGHVVAPNMGTTSGENVVIYNSSTGATLTTATYSNGQPKAVVIDPLNNVYIGSNANSINVRKLAYTAPVSPSVTPTYTTSTITSFTFAAASPLYQLGLDSNLDLFAFSGSLASSNSLYFFSNTASAGSAPTWPSSGTSTTLAIGGSTSTAAGLAIGSGNTAFTIDSAGITPVIKSGTGVTATIGANSAIAATAIPAVYNSTLYSRYAYADGNNWVYSPDGANDGTGNTPNGAATGVSVFDSTDVPAGSSGTTPGIALGTYKGCLVSASTVCGTANTAATGAQVPMYSPRAAAIDSSGDIWVASSTSNSITELIGAAAPSWPGLSMAKFGKPQ